MRPVAFLVFGFSLALAFMIGRRVVSVSRRSRINFRWWFPAFSTSLLVSLLFVYMVSQKIPGGEDGGFLGMAIGFTLPFFLPFVGLCYALTALAPAWRTFSERRNFIVVAIYLLSLITLAFLSLRVAVVRVADPNQQPVSGVDFRYRRDWQSLAVVLLGSGSEGRKTSDTDGKVVFWHWSLESIRLLEVGKPGYHIAWQIYSELPKESVFQQISIPAKSVGPTLPLVSLHWEREWRDDDNSKPLLINLLDPSPHPEAVPRWDIAMTLMGAPEGAQADSWRVRIEVPEGGVLETDDALPFLAPDDGYSPDYQLGPGGRSGREHLFGSHGRKLYVRSRNGRVHASLDVQFTKYLRGGARVEVTAWTNPHGSRNLEPDPAKQVTDPKEIRRLDVETAK